jgi:16S rRNA (cytosine967-C5)-methyltransferase
MTPAARIQATIEILEDLEKTGRPADRFIRDFFRARRYAGSKDRAAIGERVFSIFRHRASLAFRMRAENARALAIASLLGEGLGLDAIANLFSGGTYAPALLTEPEKSAILQPPQEEAPLHVRGDFPAFLETELIRAFGHDLLREVAALNARASVDLRVNSLKAERDGVCARLRAEGFDAQPTPYAPLGIRIAQSATGARLRRHALFLDGAFEIQDESAQIAAHLMGAKPSGTVLDLAAGAGGKSLAIAADMRNVGSILACDVRSGALEELAVRATRAGASIISTHLIGDEPTGRFDAVLVDAPCSGTGTWRRQPESKWRLTDERLSSLTAEQDGLLRRAASRVQPGGRLVYATCSVLPCENEDRVESFLSAHRDFSVEPAALRWSSLGDTKPPPGMERFFRATPLATGTDGFFTAVLVRSLML